MSEINVDKIYTFNDLPRFSPWPHRILGLTAFEKKIKSRIEIIREFEYEKWGAALKAVEQNNIEISLDAVNEFMFTQREKYEMTIQNSQYLLKTQKEIREFSLKTVINLLQQYSDVEHLVELGAGFGDILINIALTEEFKNKKFFAGEFTNSGQKLIELLSQKHEVECVIGQCDFNAFPMIDFELPESSLIFTFAAAMCVSYLNDSFVEQLINYKAKYVIHFEPCYDLLDSNLLMDSLCQKYIQINDYNRNLLGQLRKYEKEKKIEILKILPKILAGNPLLPLSMIIWRPI